MNKTNNKNWLLYGEYYDVFWFHSCYVNGVALAIKDRLGYGLNCVVAEQAENIQRIYVPEEEWREVGKKYLEEVVEKPDKLRLLLNDIRVAADDLIVYSKKLQTLNLSSADKKQQLEILSQYHSKHHLVWILGQVPNVLEFENSYLTDYLKSWLREKGLSEQEVTTVFQILSTPKELSAAQKQEIEILRMATQEKETTILEMNDHWQKYNWLQYGWTGPALDKTYFKAIYQDLRKQQSNSKKQLEKLLFLDKKLAEDKKYYCDKLKMPAKIKELFQLLEELLFIKAHRMDATYMSYAAVELLLKKISQDNYLSLAQVYCLYYDWLVDVIKNGANIDIINEIKKYSVRYYNGKEMCLLYGKEAHDFTKDIQASLPRIKEVNELKGECAYPGKISGRVCVVNRTSEMEKFKTGDILVSNVTDPSLLPIMKKAATFITNQGGLTCHAAIVARELHTPCVVGTKIATRVLHDGDMVEVDAELGFVRKIEPN